MKTPMGKWTLLLASLISMAASAFQSDLDTTASNLYFQDHERSQLNSKETLDGINQIKEELKALLDAHVQPAMHQEFYLPVLFEPGRLLVGLTDDALKLLAPKFDKDGNLDATKPTGIPAFDTLNAKWKITEYQRKWSSQRHIAAVFDAATNPYLVGDDFTKLPEVRYMTPNVASGIGGGTEVRRTGSTSRNRNRPPTVYVLTLGWGDCPAGCMAVHRSYFEVSVRPDGTTITKVGEAGTPLTPEMRAEYYK